MEHVIIEVDPFSLDVEWDIDIQHMMALADDIRECGEVQVPVTIWVTNDGQYRIADGFHRVAAARYVQKEHGYPKMIPVHMAGDLTENRFWELRIMSAKKHSPITAARLKQWVAHVWETDPISENPVLQVLDAYRIGLRQHQGTSVATLYKLTEDDLILISRWLKRKASKWKIAPLDLADMVAEEHIFKEWNLSTGEVKFIGQYINDCDLLSLRDLLIERRKAVEEKKIAPQRYREAHIAAEGLRHDEDGIEKLSDLGLIEYAERFEKEVKEPQRIQEQLDLEAEKRKRHKRFVAQKIAYHLDDLAQWLEDDRDVLERNAQAKTKMIELLPEIVALAGDLWGDPFVIWAERIARPTQVTLMPDQAALSSLDYERAAGE